MMLVSVGVWFLLPDTRVEPQVNMNTTNTASTTATIVAFGDSLTAGYGVPLSESYPAQLEQALRDRGYEVRVINSGVSGETTRGNLERASFIRAQDADIVILGIGGNDALRSLPVADTKKNISATLDVLLAGVDAPQVLLLQMQAPLNAGAAYKQSFDAMYAELASTKNLVLVPFLTERLFFDQSNKLADGIHYNELGYKKVIDAHILPAVMATLEAGM